MTLSLYIGEVPEYPESAIMDWEEFTSWRNRWHPDCPTPSPGRRAVVVATTARHLLGLAHTLAVDRCGQKFAVSRLN